MVYTTAIRSTGSLGESLTGISLLATQLGFTHATETLYAADCHSAAFHADHANRAVSLAVECNPRQAHRIPGRERPGNPGHLRHLPGRGIRPLRRLLNSRAAPRLGTSFSPQVEWIPRRPLALHQRPWMQSS